MKREQLTNVTTESIDERCAMLAACGHETAYRAHRCYQPEIDRGDSSGRFKSALAESVAWVNTCADRIIALRSQQVTP